MPQLSTGLEDLWSTSSSGVTAPPSAMDGGACGRVWQVVARRAGHRDADGAGGPLAGAAAAPASPSPMRPPSPP
eukprot:3917471-Alexandrium_andersonii.AAC.1